MDLDGAIEKINTCVDEIEAGFGEVSDRTISVAAWLLMVDVGISSAKEGWINTYNTEDYPQHMVDGFALLAAMGICCLEQYTNIYEESCPWEHDFSYDDDLSIEDVLMIISDHFHDISRGYYPNEDNFVRDCLEKVKEIVILCISAIMQHGKAESKEIVPVD